jgi:hypothetical protein
MLINEYIKIKHKGKEYSINTHKTALVLSKLEKLSVSPEKKMELDDFKTEDDIRKFLKKYKLYDEVFLENVNNL